MQWPPLSSSDYEFLRSFRFRPERAWDDDAAVSDAAVGKVMLLGDIHNNRQVLDAALRTAADEDCDVLVQVGDFWLQDSGWNRFAPEYAGAMSTAVHAAMPVVVIDGNHEVWPCLSEFAQRDDTAAARPSGPAASSWGFAVVGGPGQYLDLGRQAFRRAGRKRLP